MVQKKKTQAIDSIGESKSSPEPVQSSNFEHNYSPNEVRTLISWSAPGRPFKKRTKQFYLTAILVTLLVEVILFLFSQLALMAVVISLLFMSFVLASVPPKNFQYRISSEGITIEDHSYIWMELYDFYFKNRNGVEVLHIRTRALFPAELTLTLGDLDKEHVKSALLPHLPYRETIQPTFMERSADWLSRNFPLEPGN